MKGHLGVRTSGAGSGAAALEVIAPSLKGCYLKELSFSLAAATASTYALGRPAAKGITPTSPVAAQYQDGVVPMLTATALAWGTGPTAPTAFIRRSSLPATLGASIVWTFSDKGLFIPANTSLVLWNLAANGVADVSITIDE